MRKELVLKNEMSEMVRVNQFVEEIGEELGLDMELQMNLNLVMWYLLLKTRFYHSTIHLYYQHLPYLNLVE